MRKCLLYSSSKFNIQLQIVLHRPSREIMWQAPLLILYVLEACATLEFAPKATMIPHPEKAHRGGEDAYFHSRAVLCVADGVGGWNREGIDPSRYSRFLCERTGTIMEEDAQGYYLQRPLQIIRKVQRENNNVGSATLVVATVDGSTLRYCYIGDGGFMVLRKYQKYLSIYQYVEQQHSFNFPYQLAMDSVGGDHPNNSICGQLQLQQGDLVVMGSDGLWDNVDFHEVSLEVQKQGTQDQALQAMSDKFAKLAIKRGEDSSFNSPFARRAKRDGIRYTGGKLDDTTVIFARVVSAEPALPAEQL